MDSDKTMNFFDRVGIIVVLLIAFAVIGTLLLTVAWFKWIVVMLAVAALLGVKSVWR